MTAAKGSAYAIAALVYLTAAALVAGGLALAVTTRNFIGIFFGLALVALGVLMRPRFGKPPTEDVVSRNDAPALHALVGEVARALGTRPVDALVVDDDYNASWAVLGVRRKRVLRLGLPLLTALAPQERVALIAHELAHARNGDSSRSLVVGGALRAIGEFYVFLVTATDSLAHSDFAILEWISRAILWVASRPVLGLYYVLNLLLLRDSHRAEYLADALAARVAGTAAEIAADEKLLLGAVFETVAQRAGQASGGDVFEALSEAFEVVPERERERRRLVARAENVRLSASHPPTARRLALIESRPTEAGQVFADGKRSAAIDRELSPMRSKLSARIADNYRAALYGLD